MLAGGASANSAISDNTPWNGAFYTGSWFGCGFNSNQMGVGWVQGMGAWWLCTCSRRYKTCDGKPATAWQVVMMLAAWRATRGDE